MSRTLQQVHGFGIISNPITMELIVNGQKIYINKECIKYPFIDLHQGRTREQEFTAFVIFPNNEHRIQVIRKIQSPYLVRTLFPANTPDNTMHYLIIDRVEKILSLISAPVQPIKICEIMIQILKGLNALHLNGIYHENLCPDTIALFNENVKLYEFSLHMESLRKAARREKGYYKAPEQVKKQPLSDKTDVWAAGAILYYLISGKKHCFQDEEQVKYFQFNNLPNNNYEFYGLLGQMLQQQSQHRSMVKDLLKGFMELQIKLTPCQQLYTAPIQTPRSLIQQSQQVNQAPVIIRIANNSNHQQQLHPVQQQQYHPQQNQQYNQVQTPQSQPLNQVNQQTPNQNRAQLFRCVSGPFPQIHQK